MYCWSTSCSAENLSALLTITARRASGSMTSQPVGNVITKIGRVIPRARQVRRSWVRTSTLATTRPAGLP